MIIPASIFRIAGFLNKDTNKVEDTPQEGGYVFCYTESGKPVILELFSNKKETTLNDIERYINNKRDLTVKEKDIKLIIGELEEVDSFLDEIEDKFKDDEEYNSADRKGKKAKEKEFTLERATEIVTKRKTIGKGSIIKTVIDINNNLNFKKHSLGNSEIPIIRSRSLIFDNEDNPTTTGFYFYAQSPNSLPISIIPVFNKEKEALNFFKVQLSKLANLDQFNYLIGHSKRSIDKQISLGVDIYLPGINYDYEKIKNNQDIMSLIKKMRTLSQDKEINSEKATLFKEYLDTFQKEVNKNPKLIFHVNLVFNLIIGNKDLKAIVKEKSNPFINLSKSFIKLNFSKENPDVQRLLSAHIEQEIEKMLDGEVPCEISSTYFTPPGTLANGSDSWGFMKNNIQREGFVLSTVDILRIYSDLEKIVKESKV